MKSFPQDNNGNLFQRRQRNVSVGSVSSNNSIEEESGLKVIRAAVLGKDGVGKTGERPHKFFFFKSKIMEIYLQKAGCIAIENMEQARKTI